MDEKDTETAPNMPIGTRRERLAVALARGESATGAAREAGVSRSTVRRWLTEADFRSTVTTLRDERLDQAFGRLSDAAEEAIEAMRAGLNKDVDIGIRIRAGAMLLDRLLTLRNQVALEERITNLEAVFKELHGG